MARNRAPSQVRRGHRRLARRPGGSAGRGARRTRQRHWPSERGEQHPAGVDHDVATPTATAGPMAAGSSSTIPSRGEPCAADLVGTAVMSVCRISVRPGDDEEAGHREGGEQRDIGRKGIAAPTRSCTRIAGATTARKPKRSSSRPRHGPEPDRGRRHHGGDPGGGRDRPQRRDDMDGDEDADGEHRHSHEKTQRHRSWTAGTAQTGR